MIEISPIELKALMIRKRKTRRQVAEDCGLKVCIFGKKENGKVKFSDEEKLLMIKSLDMDYRQFNAIFFDGMLPW